MLIKSTVFSYNRITGLWSQENEWKLKEYSVENRKKENTKFRTAMTFLGHNCYSTTSKAKTVLQRVGWVQRPVCLCLCVSVCVCLSVSMHGGPSIAGVTQVHHGPTASASTQPWNTARAQQLSKRPAVFSIQCASSPSSPDTTDVRECSNQGLSLHDLLHNWSN